MARNVLLAIALGTVMTGSGLAAPAAPYGFGELKLGMSLSEADALRTDDRVEKCGDKETSTCLVRDDVAFSRKARIIAVVDEGTQRISAIHIEIRDFDRKKGYPCAHVADAVIKDISATYGEAKCGYRRIGCEWHLPDGGEIKTAIFCPTTDPSSGGIDVRFSQTTEKQ